MLNLKTIDIFFNTHQKPLVAISPPSLLYPVSDHCSCRRKPPFVNSPKWLHSSVLVAVLCSLVPLLLALLLTVSKQPEKDLKLHSEWPQSFCCWWAETSRKQVGEWFPIEIHTADTLQPGLEAMCPFAAKCQYGTRTNSAVSEAFLLSYFHLKSSTWCSIIHYSHENLDMTSNIQV